MKTKLLGLCSILLCGTATAAPVVVSRAPENGDVVTGFSFIGVVFSDSVTGVDASDLTVNGSAATSLIVASPREYQFSGFAAPATGTVNVAWIPSHGIVDSADPPNPFAGGGWSFTLDPNFVRSIPVISEFMADNNNGIKDDDGNREDWIEIYNPGPLDLNLNGWYLTHNGTNLTEWQIPGLFIGVNRYAIVWASAKNKSNPSAPLHTSFKLAKEGGFLALVDPATNIVSQFNLYPGQFSDVSYGRDRVDPSLIGYYNTPTPGLQNSTRGPGFMGEPVFSLSSGLYTNSSLSLTLANTNGSGTLRYTTDRSLPTNTSPAYTSPIAVNGNMTVKARIFPPAGTNLFPSATIARNFVLVDSTAANFTSKLPIVVLSTEGQGIPANVPPGGNRAKGSVTVIATFRGLSSLRSQSDFQELAEFEIFGQTSAGFAKQPIRVEIQDSLGNDLDKEVLGMPADSDWRLRNPYNDKTLLNDFLGYEVWEKMGHYSVRRRLVEVFNDTSGGKLVYPGDYYGVMMLCETIKVNKDRVDIANLSPYATNEPAISGGYIIKRDKDSGGDINFSSPGGPGFNVIPMKLHEPKVNSMRLAAFNTGAITTFPGPGYTPSGTNQMNWLRNFLGTMERAMYTNTWLAQTGTNHYSYYLDTERFADQMLHVEFTKQIDGYRLSDYFSKDRNGKFGPGPVWDWNLSYGNANYLQGGWTNGWYYELAGEQDHPWARRLITGTAGGTTSTGDPNFVQLVADRWAMFRTNVLNGTNVNTEIDQLASLLNQAAARDLYGKYRSSLIGVYTWPNPNGGLQCCGNSAAETTDSRDVDFVRPTNYLGAIETVTPSSNQGSIIGQMKKWVLGRYLWMDSQFTRVPAIVGSAVGLVPSGTTVTVIPPAGSTLYYTLNGTDPRAPGGSVISGALSNNAAVTITVTSNVQIVARAKNASAWKGTYSAAASAPFYTTIPPLRLTEIMYHPATNSPPVTTTTNVEDFEYLELKNTSASSLAVGGYRISGGIDFTFPSLTLAAGQRVLVVKNPAAFSSRYNTNGLLIAGAYTGNLANEGNHLVVAGALGESIHDFSYDNEWYRITDGFGFSLVIVDETAPLNTWGFASSWRPSGGIHGTPGQGDVATTIPAVVINEVLTHSDPPPPTDTIELRNLTGAPADIGGWYLTDDFRTPKKYRIPNGTTIAANGFVTFDESNFNPTNGNGNNIPFALSSQGDEIYLFSAGVDGNLTGYFHGFDFGAQVSGRTFGRYVVSTGEDHLVAQVSSTLGGPNSGPLVGPIVISEIHYHPPDVANAYGVWDDTEDEYIEIHNLNGAPVPLYDPAHSANVWRLRDAVDYNFPAGASLPADGYALLVSFDPANAAALAAFRANNGVSPSVPVFGPWSGKLDNSEDSIELVRPDVPDTNGVVPYVLVDKVHYKALPPWPLAADGTGPALQRLVETSYGNDPSNWIAVAQSPGAGYVPGPSPVITQQPQSHGVLGTTTAMLSLVATGAPPLSYQWRFRPTGGGSFTPLAGATSSILVLPNFSTAQAGDYYCVVHNTGGFTLSDQATLTYVAPAAINQQPVNTDIRIRPDPGSDVIPNTNAVISLVASTLNPPLTYQWRMNGTNLLPSTHYSNVTAASLIISNVTMSDLGDYSCAIADGVGTVFSSNATLYPLVRPTILIPFANQTQTVAVASPFPVSAVLSNGWPPPFFYQWRSNSIVVTTLISDSKTNFFVYPGSAVATGAVSAALYRLAVTNRASQNYSIQVPFYITTLPDADHDGIPDSVETALGLDPNSAVDALLDLDGDGMSNLAEYQAGTEPNNPASYLRVDQAITPGVSTINFAAVSNRTYTIQYSDSLSAATWSRLADFVALRTNRVEVVIDPNPGSNRFYRVVVPRQ